ncbi:DUF4199 domain-containing protein [Chryseolinea lacunae]|uniref:DUF4199 domain-containing protein n=1 Tax=Chryseolinea lacunae TaxID=2801331 RepID=A0ABS1KLK2_9BACT|nr:DUF4199 domain-containing protein [Chryseolinea lacunae]MBL0740209.1 DUF4199 domain-containing protein [Chryseolinea lacunae]
MQKIIITYGIIAGIIVSTIMVLTHPLFDKGVINYDMGMVVGYTSMVIALSVIFFGIKTYRDQHGKGRITFGQGLKIGLFITLIASLLYAITWEVYYNTTAHDFMAKYTQYELDKLAREGATPAVIEEERKSMAELAALYENPLIRFGMTITEIFPVGILISLLAAALLRKKEVLPANA